jgi:hypothetical protein
MFTWGKIILERKAICRLNRKWPKLRVIRTHRTTETSSFFMTTVRLVQDPFFGVLLWQWHVTAFAFEIILKFFGVSSLLLSLRYLQYCFKLKHCTYCPHEFLKNFLVNIFKKSSDMFSILRVRMVNREDLKFQEFMFFPIQYMLIPCIVDVPSI